GEAAEDRRARPREVEPEDRNDAADPDRDTGQARALRAFLAVEPKRQERGEDRRRRDEDSGERGGDRLLAGGDQEERCGGLDGAEDRHPSEPPPKRRKLTARSRDRQQDRRRERDPRERDHLRREVAQGDLDQEVARAPDRRQAKEESPRPTIHASRLENAERPGVAAIANTAGRSRRRGRRRAA